MKKVLFLLLCSVFVVFGNAVTAQTCTGNTGTALDNFTTATAYVPVTSPASSTTDGSGILGGERDISMSLTTTAVSGSGNGYEVMTSPAVLPVSTGVGYTLSNLTVTYDGNDNDATALDATVGLGGINMMGAGAFATKFYSDPIAAGEYATVKFRVYSSATNYSDGTVTINGPVSPSYPNGIAVWVPRTEFTVAGGLGANFASVTAVQVIVTTNRVGLDFQLAPFTIPCSTVPAPVISNVTCNPNSNINSAIDDYVQFSMLATPPTEFYQAPYTYTVTATQNGNPVTVTMSDGTAATAVPYWATATNFRLQNGTSGAGDVIINVTPNWGSYPAATVTLKDPGSCTTVACSGTSTKTVTYTYTSPRNITDVNDLLTYIPKFDQSGGKVLTGVAISYQGTEWSAGFLENRTVTAVTAKARSVADLLFSLNGSTLTTGTIYPWQTPNYSTSTVSFPPGVLVTAQGTWQGDVITGTALSTIARMAYTAPSWLDNTLALGYANWASDPRYVTNATGNPTFDDDLYIGAPTNASLSGTQTYTSASTSFANFVGTGNIPLTYSTFSGINTSGGGGNLVIGQVSSTQFTATVTYTYTETCQQLGNRVWLDNGTGGGTASDGLQNGSEPGVAGVQVDLYKGGVLIASTVTDAYGNYLFSNLAVGTDYQVKVTPPANYTFTTQTNTTNDAANDATGSDVNATTGLSYNISLAAGDSEMDIDAGLVPTVAPVLGSIGDRVWLDNGTGTGGVAGDGIQNGTEPGVAGVTVTLYASNGTTVIATTTTDANGNYLFTNLPAGDYVVGVTPLPGTTFTTGTATSTGNTTTNSDVSSTTGKTTSFTLAAGQQITGIDAGLKLDTKSSLGDLVWYDVNQNGIQDAGEPGIAGVTMTLLKETSPGSGTYTSVATTVTNATGEYIFTGLDAANYKVQATVPTGYTVTTAGTPGTGSFTQYNNSDFSPTGAVTTTTSNVYGLLDNQDYAGIDLGLYKAGTVYSIGDKVWSDVNGNGIQDAGEAGLAGITVTLYGSDGTTVLATTVTDANGNYIFPGLANGTYYVGFSNLPANTQLSPQGAGTTSTDSNPNPATGLTSAITLAGANITDVDAGVMPFVPSGKGSIGDKVWVDANNNGLQDATENGIAGVTVTLYAADGTTVLATTTTDAQGNYLFPNLDAGSYVVGFSGFPSGYALQSGKNNVGTNDLIDSDPDPTTGKTAVINLAQGQENLSVDAGIYSSTATNSIGDKVWLDNGTGGGTASDGIQNGTEPGVPGVTVNLIDANGTIISSVVTDANGNYYFGNLPNGTYQVQVVAPTGMSLTTTGQGTEATDSDASPIDGKTGAVVLSGGTNVTYLDAGLVTTKSMLGDKVWYDTDGDGIQDAGEAGIPGVLVTLYAADGTTVISSTITDANGNYLFTNLNPDTYVVGFSNYPTGLEFTTKDAAGTTVATGSDAIATTGKTAAITLVAGDINLNVDAGLRPKQLGAITGQVWFDGASGDNLQGATEPLIPGVLVTLKDAAGNVIGTTTTDGNGTYLFTNIPAGTGYTVTFSNYTGTLVTQNTTNTTSGSDPNPTTGVTGAITVTAGATTPNIDAGLTQYAPLPIELLTFVGRANNCSAVLNWSTAIEENFSHFEVERATSDAATKYTAVGIVKGNGSNSSYTFTDANVAKGSNFYRLKMVDKDGTFKYSAIVKVDLSCAGSITVRPTVTTGITNVYGLSGTQTVTVHNATGQVLKVYRASGSQVQLDLSDYASGTYLVRVTDGVNTILTARVIKP